MESNHASHRDSDKIETTLDRLNEVICKSVERVALVERCQISPTVDRRGKRTLNVKPSPACGVEADRMKEYQRHVRP
jgi:hypothetical protein